MYTLIKSSNINDNH